MSSLRKNLRTSESASTLHPSPDRLPDWEIRFNNVIADNFTRSHTFSQWDCLLWPAAAVKAVTGKDFGRGHRGKYKSLASAYRHLQQMGFDSPSALLDSLFDEKAIGYAGRGDLVLCRTLSGDVPGVVFGDYALIVGEDPEKAGLVRVYRKDWLKAWAVGVHHSGERANV